MNKQTIKIQEVRHNGSRATEYVLVSRTGTLKIGKRDFDAMATGAKAIPNGTLSVLPLKPGQSIYWMYEMGTGITSSAAWSAAEFANLATRGTLTVTGPQSWTLTPSGASVRRSSVEAEMAEMLDRAGYSGRHVAELVAEGMGPSELAERLKIKSGVGSLTYTHGFRKLK